MPHVAVLTFPDDVFTNYTKQKCQVEVLFSDARFNTSVFTDGALFSLVLTPMKDALKRIGVAVKTEKKNSLVGAKYVLTFNPMQSMVAPSGNTWKQQLVFTMIPEFNKYGYTMQSVTPREFYFLETREVLNELMGA